MNQNLQKLFASFSGKKNDKGKKESKKCKARMKNCSCGHHFKTDEKKCPECKKDRKTCGKWALDGKEVCRLHGGSGGRKMTTGANVSDKTFSDDDWDKIKISMDGKIREHEFAYQVATMAFKKIIEGADDYNGGPLMILGAATEYFTKIARYIHDIDKCELEIVHVHKIADMDRQTLEARMKNMINRVLTNTLINIMAILKKNISDPELYKQIYNDFPIMYKELIENDG